MRTFPVGVIFLFLIQFCDLFAHSIIAQKPDIQKLFFYEVVEKKFLCLDELTGEKGVLFIFTSLNCPHSILYEERIQKLKVEFEDDINVILINSNNPKVGKLETIEAMRTKARHLKVAYVSDQSKEIMNALEARKNGEVIVLARSKVTSSYIEYYRGAFDDNPLDNTHIEKRHVQVALKSLVNNQPKSTSHTKPIGCRIK